MRKAASCSLNRRNDADAEANDDNEFTEICEVVVVENKKLFLFSARKFVCLHIGIH